MRVLITGATGLIGKEIVDLCHAQNIDVNYLTTTKSKLENKENYKGFYWNPYLDEIDTECFTDVNVIIHLAGANVAKRWTKSYRDEIIKSRVEVTQFLFTSLKKQNHNINQIISASAIGIYPDSLTKYYEESNTEFDSSFLSYVVQEWENSVDVFSNLNLNVAKIRIGLVLSNNGGALPKVVQPIKLGFGTIFGTGDQWQSWIHIEDLAQLFLFILKNNLNGVYNGVAPNPVSHKEFTKTIAKILNRPIWLPKIPKIMMKLILGDMHSLLYDSQRVSSKKIENLGFNFEYHHLQTALEDLLNN
ncbi:TIGR01777 family oxidoreductase [Yeosuana sp. MJ-SS3]|uniref:TIGR01777 family oxidoreductase n=1 Tax=Gilvirhabdus luticola TaxID=3079858 RepID=A0ABU3U6P6_9FLAO|nr:TIGR01777 family oxidoreductase [Yeosuana sp. MJ-SS3]MDU8886073.1 TIGR01777 family oxidoreductase [Yeosuana sp. MJ-SS3]